MDWCTWEGKCLFSCSWKLYLKLNCRNSAELRFLVLLCVLGLYNRVTPGTTGLVSLCCKIRTGSSYEYWEEFLVLALVDHPLRRSLPQRLWQVCPLVLVEALLLLVRPLVLVNVFDTEDSWETSSGCSGSIVFWRSSILGCMVEKKLIKSGCCAVMCCIATAVSDMELIGLCPWSLWYTVSLCCLLVVHQELWIPVHLGEWCRLQGSGSLGVEQQEEQ